MKFNAAIFDMDGLMFDTEELFLRAFEGDIGKAVGYRFTREGMKQLIGLNRPAAIEKFPQLFPGCPESGEACLQRYRAWMDDYIRENGVPVKPGLRKLLAWLKQAHILCAVATSTFTNVAIGYLKNAGVLNCFAAIVGGDQVTKSKPDPEIFQLAMRALGKQTPADGSADAENDRRRNAASGCRDRDAQIRLYRRCAERQRRVLILSGHCLERSDRNLDDGRQDHDGKHDDGRKQARAVRDMKELADTGNQNQHADKAIDDRRNAGQQAHSRRQDALEPRRGELREIDSGKKSDRNAQHNRARRAVDARQNEWQNAVLRVRFLGGSPDLSEQEGDKADFPDGGNAGDNQIDRDEKHAADGHKSQQQKHAVDDTLERLLFLILFHKLLVLF